MSVPLTAAILSGCGVLTATVAYTALRDRSHEWDLTATYVVTIACLYLVPGAISQFRGGTTDYVDVFHQTTVVVDSGLYSLQRAATPLYITLGLAALMLGIRAGRPAQPSMIFGAMTVLAATGATALAGGSGVTIRSAALVSIFIGAATLRPGRGGLLGLACVGLGLAILSSFLITIDFGAATRPCRSDKCAGLGYLINGVQSNENVLGLLIVSTLPAIYLAFSGWRRSVLFWFTLAFVCLTGSRTALEAAVVLALAVLLRGRAKVPGLLLLLAAGTVLGLFLPFINTDGSAYTGRGALWALARERWATSRTFGLGTESWRSLIDIGRITSAEQYGPHNQWLDVLYTSGLVGFALVVVMFLAVFLMAGRSHFEIVALMLIPGLYCGVLERPWTLSTLDGFAWVLPSVLLCLPWATVLPHRELPALVPSQKPSLPVSVSGY